MSENKQVLLPCPCCSGEAFLIYSEYSGDSHTPHSAIECSNCSLGVTIYDHHNSEKLATASWNRRAVLSASAGEKRDAERIENIEQWKEKYLPETRERELSLEAFEKFMELGLARTKREWKELIIASKSNQEQSTNKEGE